MHFFTTFLTPKYLVKTVYSLSDGKCQPAGQTLLAVSQVYNRPYFSQLAFWLP